MGIFNSTSEKNIFLENTETQPKNLGCKLCGQIFGYAADFKQLDERSLIVKTIDLDWDIRINDERIVVSCECGNYLGTHWEDDVMIFKKTAVKNIF